MIGYVKCFQSNKTMSFKISDNKLMKKYNKIWEKRRNILNMNLIVSLFLVINVKMKIYDGNVNTNFQGKKAPKENASYIDSVVKVKKKYSLQTLLEDCKHEIKKTKIENFISDELEPRSSDNETESDSDNEYDNEPKELSKKSDNGTENESDSE